MDKKESFYWDLVKGTAIFLMLWGHCIQYCSLGVVKYFDDIVFKTIYSFHMPVFMLVSGYLFFSSFRKRNLADLLEHRIRGMLHPIVMATFFNNLLLQIPSYVLSGRVEFLFGSLFQGIGDDLWFLWTVLYCSLVIAVCCKTTDHPCGQLMLVILGVFAILLLPQWNLTLFMYPYFTAGFFAGKYRDHARKLYRVVRYAVLVLFPVMLAFYEKKHYIYITPIFSRELEFAETFAIALFRWTIGFAGSIWLLTVLDFLLHLGERIPGVQLCLKVITHLGRNSLPIYCLSASLLSGYLPHLYRKFVELAGGNLFAENRLLYDCLLTPLLAVFWSGFLYLAVVLMKKVKLHQLIFGR